MSSEEVEGPKAASALAANRAPRRTWWLMIGLAGLGAIASGLGWASSAMGVGLASLIAIGGVAWLGSRSARRARAARVLLTGEGEERLDDDARAELGRMRGALEKASGQPITGGELTLGDDGGQVSAPDPGDSDPRP